MSLSRRSFIRVAGSSALIMAAGAGAFVATREPARALAPWRRAGAAQADPRRRALSYAILAPNPHNRQPWLVDLRGDGEALLYCDPERLLPETDPFNRQIVIGLGCFVELLRMAAAEDGYRALISPFPEGEPEDTLDARPVARIEFLAAPDQARDPLFGFVLERRSNKEPYDTTRPVEDAKLAAVAAAAGGEAAINVTNDPARVAVLRELTWRAMLMEIETPRTYMESVRLMRIGKSEIEARPDGIDLGGPLLEASSLLGVLTRDRVATPGSLAYRQGLEMFEAVTGTAMAYLWLSTKGNRRVDQLEAGRAYLRANLKATELGLGIHPLSQALQEYAEMASIFEELRQSLSPPGDTRIQMLARLGYGPRVPPSPRWGLATRMIET